MKHTVKFLLIIALCAIIENATAQAPAGINFQGYARSQFLVNLEKKLITLRFNIRDKTPNGPALYTEVRNTTTDSFGVFNVEIGALGAVSQSGDIRKVKWSDTTQKFLQVELDTHENATGFLNMGTTQLMSVPYSFYSDVSDSARLAAKADSAEFSNSSGKYFFSATIPSKFKQTISKSSNTVKFPSVLFNENEVYDSATSVFTAPEDGIYEFDISVDGEFVGSEEEFSWVLVKNDTICKVLGTGEFSYDNGNKSFTENFFNAQVRLKLEKGSKIAVKLFGDSKITIEPFDYFEDDYGIGNVPPAAFTEFSGYKIK